MGCLKIYGKPENQYKIHNTQHPTVKRHMHTPYNNLRKLLLVTCPAQGAAL
jgi:hypothetical protein